MSDFKAKNASNRISAGALLRPCWQSLQRSPDPLAGFNGPTSKGSGEEQMGWEWKERKGHRNVVEFNNFLKIHPLRVQFHTASQVCCLRLPCSV